MRSILLTLLVFVFKVIEAFIQWIFRRSSQPPPSPRGLSPREQVLELERIRRRRAYKPGWLYYRCRELGLAETLRDLREEKVID